MSRMNRITGESLEGREGLRKSGCELCRVRNGAGGGAQMVSGAPPTRTRTRDRNRNRNRNLHVLLRRGTFGSLCCGIGGGEEE